MWLCKWIFRRSLDYAFYPSLFQPQSLIPFIWPLYSWRGQMPFVKYENHAARSFDTPPILLLRDIQTQLTPNETQRNTLIVAGVYFIAILLLWWGPTLWDTLSLVVRLEILMLVDAQAYPIFKTDKSVQTLLPLIDRWMTLVYLQFILSSESLHSRSELLRLTTTLP